MSDNPARQDPPGIPAPAAQAAQTDALAKIEMDGTPEGGIALPGTLDEITEAWLTSAFRQSGLLDAGTSVQAMKTRKLGSDEGMMADKLMIDDIVYATAQAEERDPPGQLPKHRAPSSCMVKIPPTATGFPRAFVNAGCKIECYFYQHLQGPMREKFGVWSPQCYFVGTRSDGEEPSSHRYVCVLEHMTHPQRSPGLPTLRPGKMIEGDVPLECALLAVQQLAALHAAYWEMDREAFRAPEPPGGGAPFLAEVSHSAEAGQLTRSCGMLRSGVKEVGDLFAGPAANKHLPPGPEYDGFRLLGQCMQELYPKLRRKLNAFAKRMEKCPTALNHGDTTCENLFYSTSACSESDGVGPPQAIWFDFQGLKHSAAVRDVSWFVTSSFSVERRRAVEEQLVRCYYDALGERLPRAAGDGVAAGERSGDRGGPAGGGRSFESFEQCFQDYGFCLHAVLLVLLGVSTMRWRPMARAEEASGRRGIFSETALEPGSEELRRELEKSNQFCVRVVAALDDHRWAALFEGGEEDSEEQNPTDLATPCNFG